MVTTLAQAQLNALDDVQLAVIEQFRKTTPLLERMPFDDVVNPAGGGATLTYGYTREATQRTATTRQLNTEYTPGVVTRSRHSVDLAPLGGAFRIDRVLARVGPAASSEVEYQLFGLVKATRAKFHDMVINGDVLVDANGFDGLSKALTGSTTEVGTGTALATGQTWSTVATQAAAFAAIEWVDLLLSKLDGRPDFICGSEAGIRRLKQLARWTGNLTQTEDAFGRLADAYDGIPLLDLGEKAGSADPVVPVESRDLDGAGGNAAVTGLTDLYAIRVGLDAFHGVSTPGPLLQTYGLATAAGFAQVQQGITAQAVQEGQVEMGPCAVALKATKAAAVLRNIKVA